MFFKLFAKEDHGGANTYRGIGGSLVVIDEEQWFEDAGTIDYHLFSHGAHTVITPGALRIEYGLRHTSGEAASGYTGWGFHHQFVLSATLYRKLD